MTAVEEIRRAAALMRKQAQTEAILRDGDPYYTTKRLPDGSVLSEMSVYEASWHPAVALAVADWLDDIVRWCEDRGDRNYVIDGDGHALLIARAYLGEP